MSQNRINKYVDSPIYFSGKLRSKSFLISDSKGNYVRKHSDLIEDFGYSIEFICKGGARFADQYYWLTRNLHNKVRQYGSIVLYIWLGTCDLTSKQGKYIDLRHNDDKVAISYLKFQIDRFLSVISGYPSVRIVFLEIPEYSIECYNRSRGHKDPKIFHSSDLVLTERISLVNEYIREINSCRGVRSPRFKFDLLNYRKAKRETTFKRTTLNFSNYNDGIHPNYRLARCWMKRIVVQILRDCV